MNVFHIIKVPYGPDGSCLSILAIWYPPKKVITFHDIMCTVDLFPSKQSFEAPDEVITFTNCIEHMIKKDWMT